jgi:hypothetical protein
VRAAKEEKMPAKKKPAKNKPEPVAGE